MMRETRLYAFSDSRKLLIYEYLLVAFIIASRTRVIRLFTTRATGRHLDFTSCEFLLLLHTRRPCDHAAAPARAHFEWLTLITCGHVIFFFFSPSRPRPRILKYYVSCIVSSYMYTVGIRFSLIGSYRRNWWFCFWLNSKALTCTRPYMEAVGC